ncbi:MAG: 2-hydroxyacyl-CoA dehydratase, partial [Candidatus Hydrogenedentes bacterium]|nr:2-hydroxyacyl-CoA dehydratase [Candidatus Hydrogenedentota bacterium]
MGKCCGEKEANVNPADPCSPPDAPCAGGGHSSTEVQDAPLAWFENMIENCLEYASACHDAGRPIVGIMCEYAPRELIMAAGAIPVCLCGGSANTIPAAEEHLPSNLCPLIKSTYGYHLQKSNPFLEMAELIVAETTCDGKKKMFELIAESRPTYVLELPQKENDADAMEYWVSELRKFKHELEVRFDVEITEDKIREAIGTMNRERRLRRDLAALMKSDAPPLTGRQLLDFKSTISGIPADFEQYEKALSLLKDREGCPDMSTRVRILLTGVPIVHGAERVLEIIEGRGGLVVCMENCTGLKPILDDVDATAADPIRALAEKYFKLPCSVKTKNEARVESLRKLAAEYRPECIIELVWQACLTYDIESLRIKRFAETELGVPYLRVETDYSPSDSARIEVRVEAL